MQKQSDSSQSNTFLMNVLSMFDHEKDTKTLAIRWLQLEMDAMSRSCLPQLQHHRNHLWKELKGARDKENSDVISRLEEEISSSRRQHCCSSVWMGASYERSSTAV